MPFEDLSLSELQTRVSEQYQIINDALQDDNFYSSGTSRPATKYLNEKRRSYSHLEFSTERSQLCRDLGILTDTPDSEIEDCATGTDQVGAGMSQLQDEGAIFLDSGALRCAEDALESGDMDAARRCASNWDASLGWYGCHPNDPDCTSSSSSSSDGGTDPATVPQDGDEDPTNPPPGDEFESEIDPTDLPPTDLPTDGSEDVPDPLERTDGEGAALRIPGLENVDVGRLFPGVGSEACGWCIILLIAGGVLLAMRASGAVSL